MAEVRALSCMHWPISLSDHVVQIKPHLNNTQTTPSNMETKAYYSRIMLSANATKICPYYSKIMPA